MLVRNLGKAWPPERETPVEGAFHKLHICGPRVKPAVRAEPDSKTAQLQHTGF